MSRTMILFTNTPKMILYASISLLLLIYLTGIFAISEFIKFIKCTVINFKNPFFQARNSKLNLLYISLFICILYLINPLILILLNCNIDNSIPLFMSDITNNILLLCFFTRCWVFCFDRYFIDSLKNWIWRREVNPREAETHLIIKYKIFLSSNRRLLITILYILFPIIPIFTLLILSDLNIIYHLIYRILCTFILIILLFSTYYLIHTNMPIITNEYGLRQELLYCVKSSGIFYILGHICYIIFCSTINNNSIAIFIEVLFFSIANIFIIYFSCYWTRQKFIYESISKLNATNHKRRRSFLTIFTSKQHVSFDDIMNNRSGIEAFCHHLSNEYGLESILFLIESCQFKANIYKLYPEFINNSIQPTDNIILSVLNNSNNIFSKNNILNIDWMPIDPRMIEYSPYKIGLYLYDKYIENSADLCINISSVNRREIYRKFKDLANKLSDIRESDKYIRESENDIVLILYQLFDNAYQEIWHLIKTDTFIRFKSTQQFHKLIYILFPIKAKEALNQSQQQLLNKKSKVALQSHSTIDRNAIEKVCPQKPIEIHSASPISPIEDDIDMQLEINDEKKPDFKLMRSTSLPTTDSSSLFSLTPTDNNNNNHNFMRYNTDQHMKYNTMRIKNIENINIENKSIEIENIIVPSDIIKTAADFWRNYMETLPNSEKLEIGVALYLSMIASDRHFQKILNLNDNLKLKKQLEILSLKFLNMIGGLIQLLWNRNNQRLHNSLNKLGKLHSNLKIKIIYFNIMLTCLHETLKFYFPVKYRLQEQYSFDYIFSYAAEIMMKKPLSTKTKSKTYYKMLQVKFNSEKKLNQNIRPKNANTLHLSHYNQSMPVKLKINKKLVKLPTLNSYNDTSI